jgi:hypothetical protein
LETLAREAGVHVQTARRTMAALSLARRWLAAARMTWRELTAYCRAAGRPLPRRDHLGCGPYLWTVLDGEGRPASEFGVATPRPGPVRTRPREAASPEAPSDEASAPAEGASPAPASSAPSAPSSADNGTPEAEAAWVELVEAHAKRAEAVYGLRPPRPAVSSEQKRTMAEQLAAAAVTLAARMRERTGADVDAADVRPQLAARVVALYFKREGTGGYLRRERHPLRDLSREIHARVTEAMEALLREHVEAAPPPPRRVVPAAVPLPEQQQAVGAVLQVLQGTMLPGEPPRRHELPAGFAPFGPEPAPPAEPCDDAADSKGLAEDAPLVAEAVLEEPPAEPAAPLVVLEEPASPPPPENPVAARRRRDTELFLAELAQEQAQQPPSSWEPVLGRRSGVLARLRTELAANVPEGPVPSPQPPEDAASMAEASEGGPPAPGPAVWAPLRSTMGAPRWGATGPRPARVRHMLPRRTDPEEDGEGGGPP